MLNKIFTRIANRIIVRLSVILYLLSFNILLSKTMFKTYGILMFNKTYISIIDTPTYGEYTKSILVEFNSMGDNKIISFNKIKNGRPVEIHEISDAVRKLYPETLGMTFPRYDNCIIFIRKGLAWEDYRKALLHEYGHCMGYDHVINKYDLMYKYLVSVDKEENIRYYARRIKKDFYE